MSNLLSVLGSISIYMINTQKCFLSLATADTKSSVVVKHFLLSLVVSPFLSFSVVTGSDSLAIPLTTFLWVFVWHMEPHAGIEPELYAGCSRTPQPIGNMGQDGVPSGNRTRPSRVSSWRADTKRTLKTHGAR